MNKLPDSCPLALAVLGLLCAPVHAATPGGFEEIVVTARRQPVPQIDTPLSLDRIGNDAIDLTGATHSAEILNRVPGAMVQRGSGEESLPAIRSPVLTGAGSCGAFLVLENGVPIRPVGFCNVNELFEVNTEQADAIEVLRGPGSALYGSNAVHGTVNVLQDAPDQLPPASASLDVGADAYYRAGLEAAETEGSAATSIKALYTHDGGWRDSSGFDEGKLNATAAFGEGGFAPARFDLAATWLDQQTAGYVLGHDAYRDESLSEGNDNPEAYRKAHAVRLTGLVEPEVGGDLGELQLRPYLRSSRMEFLQHFLLGKPLERNGQDSAGVMSSFDWSLPARHSLVTGVDLEWADTYLVETQDHPTTDGSPAANAIRPAGKHYDYTVTSNVAAAYGQYEFALTDALHVGAGVRLEYVSYDYDNRMLAGNTDDHGVPCPGGCLYSRPADRRDTFTNAAPKLSVRWSPLDGVMLYANASRGFRPPEMTELYRLQRTQTLANLDSEQADSIEAGLRAATEDWRVELAAFDMRKKHLILRDSNGFYVDGGSTSHRGVEYQVTWQALESLSATVGGTFARHQYEFSRAIEAGETITEGNDVDTAPRELLRAALNLQPSPQWSGEAEWLMVGEYWEDASNLHRYPGHELLNLRARWQPRDAWAFTLRVQNALDRRYADRADYAFGSDRYFPGRPRAVFAEVAWSAR